MTESLETVVIARRVCFEELEETEQRLDKKLPRTTLVESLESGEYML